MEKIIRFGPGLWKAFYTEILTEDNEPVVPLKVTNSPYVEHAIASNCTNDIPFNRMGNMNGQEMWDYLRDTYCGKDRFLALQGMKDLANFAYDEGSMLENLSRLQTLVAATEEAAGSKSFDIRDLAIGFFLEALPEPYSYLRYLLEKEVLPPQEKFNEMSKQLLDEERRFINRNNESKSAFSGAVKRTRCEGRSKDPSWKCDPSKHPSKRICRQR